MRRTGPVIGRGLPRSTDGKCHAGHADVVGALNLPAALAAFRRHNPLVTVRLRQSLAGSAGHLEANADGRMDLALVSITERPSPLIALRELT